MCRKGGSLGSFLSSLLSSVLAAAVEWGKFGQFFVIFVVFGSCSSSGMGEVWAVFVIFVVFGSCSSSRRCLQVLCALQEYGDDGIRHDDVKDFFNDAYAHKTLL
jgi:hypothetical protein